MATTPLLTRRTALLAKAESVPGTPETLGAADGKFLVINPQYTTQFVEYERLISRNTLSNVPNTVTQKAIQLTFQLEVRRSNTGNTPDEWASTLLPACAMKETIGGSDVVYTPSSETSEWSTLTMALNIDGYAIEMAGAMGTVEWSGTVGEVMLMSFTFNGFLVREEDEAQPSIDQETGLPYPFQGIDLVYATGTRFVVSADATPATAGNFTLTIAGKTTGLIPYNDDGTAAITAIDSLFGTGSTTATMLSGADLSIGEAILELTVSNQAHKAVTIDNTAITGSGHRLASTVVQITADATPATAGTFTVTFDSDGTPETGTFNYDDNATEIESVIDALTGYTGTDAIFTSGADLGTANANVYVLVNPVTTGGNDNVHVESSVSGLTGNPHVIEAETQEIVTGDDICVDSVTIALNNDVQVITCANNPSGIVRYSVVARAPTIAINPQLTLDADVDGLAAYWKHVSDQIMTYVSFHAGILAGVDSPVSFVAPEVYWTEPGQADRNGISVVPLTGNLTSDAPAGDDELVVTLT